ncbi:MAG: hydroxymethylpyrimidine/phosphomethylpyrimidine kinase [Flavobacteriales bacterium]
MARIREKVLTIAGFDPSGGAGILADIKAFEENKCLGMAVQTAFTIQNEVEVEDVFWHADTKVEAQIKILAKTNQFDAIKIGICKDFEKFIQILNWCHQYFPKAKVIWDPILKSSSGFDFIGNLNADDIPWTKIDWITPNWTEAKAIFNLEDESLIKGIQKLNLPTKILVKGGHNPKKDGRDHLITNGNIYPFKAKRQIEYQKHGSGCIFSASLTAMVARHFPDIKAVLKSKKYTLNCLESNSSLLAYHKKG